MTKLTPSEAAEFIAYQWRAQCREDIREYEYGDPVFASEAEFIASLSEYLQNEWPVFGPGTEYFEEVKGQARVECKIKPLGIDGNEIAIPRTCGSQVLVGQTAILKFLNSQEMLKIAPPGRTQKWTASMVRNGVERGELPIMSGDHRPWRCSTAALISWFTDRLMHIDETTRLDEELRENILQKRRRAEEARYAQKLRTAQEDCPR